jgi:hypothetical protein
MTQPLNHSFPLSSVVLYIRCICECSVLYERRELLLPPGSSEQTSGEMRESAACLMSQGAFQVSGGKGPVKL